MSGRIPQEFIEQLLSRIDLVSIIDTRVSLRKQGREFVARCPFHEEKTPSFTVSPQKQFYHCFGCGSHGNAIGFLMDYERLGFIEAVEELAGSVGMALPSLPGFSEESHQDLIWLQRAADYFHQQLFRHSKCKSVQGYLRRRGLNRRSVEHFQMGYAPPGYENLMTFLLSQGATTEQLSVLGLVSEKRNGGYLDRFRNRLMFPIRDRRGQVIAFGARALDDTPPKYLNSPETNWFHKSQTLYGGYEALQVDRHLSRLLVVEGYMDVVALTQAGINGAVATLGTATTSDHVSQCLRLSDETVFCFDGDRAGRKAAWRALENTLPLLRDKHRVRFLFLPEGEDPDSLVRKEGREHFDQLVQQAQPLMDYLFQNIRRQLDMNSVDGSARLVARVKNLLMKLPEVDYRDVLLARLADMAGISRHRLQAGGVAVQARSGKKIPSPLRKPAWLGVGLLLNRPELAANVVNVDRFSGYDNDPAMETFMELTALLVTSPQLKTAAQILLHFEGHPQQAVIRQLAGWQPEYSEALWEAEFLGVMGYLEKKYGGYQRLLTQWRAGTLDDTGVELLKKQLLNRLVQGTLDPDEQSDLQLLTRKRREGE